MNCSTRELACFGRDFVEQRTSSSRIYQASIHLRQSRGDLEFADDDNSPLTA
ncbi:UNVERIFIED_CONTAM: hypothetical protein Slati_2417800 [Sesamum latifolium]|uniref:Uncharacterized protein n=1 Tax=Sesamum latifolium TaxID=2727402 RepID=A0AAW2WCH8_9LAMI